MSEAAVPSFPPFPKIPFEQIPSRNCPVGGRVLHHGVQTLGSIGSELKTLCDRCDSLREQIRTTAELPLSLVPTFGEYVVLATKLTEGLNLSTSGIGVLISYRNTTLANLEFDFCCLGFNVVVGLLKSLARVSLNTSACIPEVTGVVKYSRTICDRVRELYREDFRAVLTRDMVTNLSMYVNAWFGYTLVLVAFFKGQLGNSAKVANVISRSFASLIPPQPGFATFLSIYADIQYFRQLARGEIDEYGVALSYGRNAVERFKSLPSKFDAGLLQAIRQFIESFKVELEQLERNNRMIYCKIVPKYSEIPATQIPQLPPLDIWKSPTTILSINDILRQKIENALNQRVTVLRSAADQAICGADACIQTVPTDRIAELMTLVSALNSLRTLAQRNRNEVAAFPPGTFDGHPQTAKEVQNLNSAMSQGVAADERYEMQYAKAKSSIEKIEQLAARITDLKARIVQERPNFEKAAQGAREGKKDKETEVDIVGQSIEATVAHLNAAVAQINTEFATKLQHYLAETEAVKLGFGKGIDFWRKISIRYESLRNILGGLA
jgi:hypothetical protein